MSEPTSEWGKELVQRVVEINAQVSTLSTIGKVLLWLTPVVIAIAGWTLLSVNNLQASAAVLEAGQKALTTDLKQVSDDIRRVSTELGRVTEATQKLQVQTTRLETIVDRLERTTLPPPPPLR